MRDVAGTFVRHAMVAEKGVREIVCTFSISGGGPTGWAGVVVVVVVSLGEPLAGLKGHARAGRGTSGR